jgi:hypothetical protein
MAPNSPGPPIIIQPGIVFEFPTDEVLTLLDTLTNLLQQSSQLFNLLQDNILHPKETEVAILCITVIHNNIKTISHQISSLLPRSLQHMINKAPRLLTPILLDIKSTHTRAWQHLSYPHTTPNRILIYKVLQSIHQVITYITTYQLPPEPDLPPHRPAYPSIETQVIHRPIKILDPQILALKQNYYYVLTPDPIGMTIAQESNMDTTSSNGGSSPTRSVTTTAVTVEHSLEAIANVIQELEMDDPPSQPTAGFVTPTTAQTKSFTYCHRFAIYRRNTGTQTTGNPSQQLALFKSFAKCLKSIDHSSQILPVRSDKNIYPLSTSDQILQLEAIGLTNYFRPYRQNRKTLSGDFNIATKLTFEELQDNKGFQTWLHQHGYNIIKSSCQTADMVRIGFLTRVRTFTYRDDMHAYISSFPKFRDDPFYFRIYFDTFISGGKGNAAHVMMIDVDRPSIDKAMLFFQQHYNGDQANSPNDLTYMFFPLLRKSYTDEERNRIIADHTHYTEKDSVVALRGLQDLETVITLHNGMNTTIRKLLLSIPAVGTTTGQLFVQIEKQSTTDWLLCCFHSQDSAKVTVRLNQLEDIIKKVVHQDSHGNLFVSDHTISFNGQVAPVPRGRARMPRYEVPSVTNVYANESLQRLYQPTPKRLATELDPMDKQDQPGTATPIGRHVPTQIQPTYASVAHVTPTHQLHHGLAQIQTPNTNYEALVHQLQVDSQAHGKGIIELQHCCQNLLGTTDKLEKGMEQMNNNINARFNQLFQALAGNPTTSNLPDSPVLRQQKIARGDATQTEHWLG